MRITCHRWSSLFWTVPANGRRRSLLQVCGRSSPTPKKEIWSCVHHRTLCYERASLRCSSRYIRIYIYTCAVYVCLRILNLIYSGNLSLSIYLMRVRARLLGPYYCYYCRYTLLWDLAIIIWLLVAVARGCVVLIAMNVSTLYYDTAAVPYVIPLSKRARPSCDNVDIVKRVASYRATNRLHVFLSPFLFYSPLFI